MEGTAMTTVAWVQKMTHLESDGRKWGFKEEVSGEEMELTC